MLSFICVLLVLCEFIQMSLTQDFKKVCYVRPAPDIPVYYIIERKLCTHLIVGFVSIENNTIQVDDTNNRFYILCKSIINQLNSDIKLMISIGGGNNEKGFHSTALTDSNRKQFAKSALQVIHKYDLNGIDLDWEFPGWATVYNNDKHTFSLLLKELKETFVSYSQQSGKDLVLSAAVAAQYTIIARSYNVPQINKYVDFINLMSYDYYLYHWYWPFVGHNSPLYGHSLANIYLLNTLNTQWSAKYWNQLGVHKSKIIVGIPTYGRQFRLAFRWFTRPGSLALSGTKDITYSQVCQFLKTPGTVVTFDDRSGVPYAFRDNTWITFESTDSAKQKAQWISDNGFGGVMTFSLNADHFDDQCPHNQLFAIHSAINSIISSQPSIY